MAGVFAFIFLLALIWGISSLIVNWKLYKKAGFKGWEAIIPYYNTYVFGLISKKPLWMVWAAIGLSLVGVVPVLQFLGLIGLVFYIILLVGFIQQYETSGSFWAFYILLPIVAVFMVDKVEYTGGGVTVPGQAVAPTEASVVDAEPAEKPAVEATKDEASENSEETKKEQ